MKVSHVVLAIALLAALGSWMMALGSWSTAFEPEKLGALFISCASVLAGAFGVNRSDIFRTNGNGNGANGGGKVPQPPGLYPQPPKP